MKKAFTWAFCLMLFLALAKIPAQTITADAVKGNAAENSARTVKIEKGTQDTTKKSTSTASSSKTRREIKIKTQSSVSPRVNELNKEINQLVAKYKTMKGKTAKKEQKKFSQLTSEEKEKVRQEADRYLYRRYNEFRRGDDKTKWDMIERYYYQKYSLRNENGKRNQSASLSNEIRRKLGNLFDLREEGKKDEIRKLQSQIDELKGRLKERQKSKRQIVENRMRELLGEPSNLKW